MSAALHVLRDNGLALAVAPGNNISIVGLAALPAQLAQTLVGLARANKEQIVAALKAECPYSTEYLNDMRKARPQLACCPKARWWWVHRDSACPGCERVDCPEHSTATR